MTGPDLNALYQQAAQGGSIDWLGQFGPQSQMARDEAVMFNSSRDALLNQIMGVRAGQMQVQQTQQRTQPQNWHDEDLVGAAIYWGVPEQAARSMPRDHLIEMVNQFRNQARPADVSGAVTASFLAPLAQFGVGAAEAITGGLSKLPIVGESIRRGGYIHSADMYLRGLEEGVRSSTPESMQGLESVVNVAGNVAAMWVPANAAWNIAGVAGKVIPFGMAGGVLGPIARAGFQGGASLALLTGGSEEFGEHPGTSLLEGAAFGVAAHELGALADHFAPQIQKLANKVTYAFVPKDILQPGDLSGMGNLGVPEQGVSPMFPGEGFGAPMDAAATELTGRMPPQADHIGQLRHMAAGGDEQAKAILAEIDRRPVKPPEVDPDALAAQMNKAGNIVQSPAFPEIAGRTLIDETAAADAVIATNPGGSNLVQGVSDPMQLVRGLEDSQTIYSPYVRYAQRGTRLDAMISDRPITDEMVGEYQSFGLYTGQKVLTTEGIAGTVNSVEPAYAWIQPMYHDVPWRVPHADLHPWTTSPGVEEVPQLWNQFNAYVDSRVGATTEAMGNALSPTQITTVRQQNLAGYMEDFLDEVQIKNPGDRARVRQYFNIQYVAGFKNLAPMESAIQNGMVHAAHSVEKPEPTPIGALDKAAAVKGFVVVPEGATGKVSVVESTGLQNGMPAPQPQPGQPPITIQSAGSRITFGSIEDAQKWVTQVNRDIPDITPASDVPLELQQQHLTDPTQGPNLNNQAPKIVESLREMETANVEGGGSSNIPPAEVALATGNTGRLQNAWTDGFLKWQPARRMFSKIDQALYEHFGKDVGFAKTYDDISNAVVMHHNDQHPWMDRATDILKPVKTSRLVDGSFTRIYEIEDDAARMSAAQSAGFKPEETQALEQVHQFFRDMFPETGLDANREIKRYVSHIAQRQSTPEMVGQAFEGYPLGPTTQPFYEYARTGNLNAREMDMRELMNTYVRSVTWNKNMKAPFDAALEYTKGLQDDATMKPAGDLMENWLKVIRYGYHANDDLALDAMHGVLRAALGSSVTRQQARELFNFGLNATHSGLLGYRFNVMARDAQQFWLAVPRAGGDLLASIKAFTTDPGARTRIWNQALDAGAIALQSPRMVAPGDFAGELESIGQGTSTAGLRMQTVGKITSAIRDILPDWMQNTRDTIWHPMYLYGKQSELMRALVYDAGFNKATRALETFRAGQADASFIGKQASLDQLMGESAARTFDPSWQRQFQAIVASGDDAKAASFLGRQLADATQFKYGAPETAYAAKSITGRVALQFGNYSMQYYQYLREASTNGTVLDRAKMYMLAGGMTAAIEAASEKTGWNFRYMNPWFGLGFTGGPWLGLMTSMASGVNSAIQTATGNEPTPGGLANMAEATNALGKAGSMLNPLSGLVTGVQGIGQAMQSPYPALAATRFLITGDQSQAPDINLQMQAGAYDAMLRSMGPQQSPVRAGAWGTTQITPQLPVYPIDIGGTAQPGQSMPQPAPLDTSPISFNSNPQPYTSSQYQYQDVEAALHGDPGARRIFTPDEQQVMDSLQGMPHDIAVGAFRQYMEQKARSGGQQYNTGRGQQVPPQPVPPQRSTPNPGGGAMF